ncbi:thioesterase II family protein [Streptomyces violaceusniger]
MPAEIWLRGLRPGGARGPTLLLLPSAGGGPYSMSALVSRLPGDGRVFAAVCPGRSGRPEDPPAEGLDCIADGLAAAIAMPPTDVLAVFGHSLGAMVGWRLSRLMEGAGHRLLAFVAADCPHPHRAPSDLHELATKKDEILVEVPFGGDADPAVPTTALNRWCELTTARRCARIPWRPLLPSPSHRAGDGSDPSPP